ncbi:MAG TPA: hypothetical protein DCM59_08330 [Clostridium sp.]|nr:hypothetical protein [Clostridium sp.]
MDYGLIIILLATIIYYAFQYKKDKKAINLFFIFLFTGLILYGTKYPVVSHLQQSHQKILGILFGVFALVILFIGYRNNIKNKIHK